jgi:hypothetical protein
VRSDTADPFKVGRTGGSRRLPAALDSLRYAGWRQLYDDRLLVMRHVAHMGVALFIVVNLDFTEEVLVRIENLAALGIGVLEHRFRLLALRRRTSRSRARGI